MCRSDGLLIMHQPLKRVWGHHNTPQEQKGNDEPHFPPLPAHLSRQATAAAPCDGRPDAPRLHRRSVIPPPPPSSFEGLQERAAVRKE